MKKVNPNKKICRKPQGYCYWTKERCLEEAKKYDRRVDFHKKASSAYSSAHRNKWLDEICSHMQSGKKPYGYWTKERCWEEAKKFTSKADFGKYAVSAYDRAKRKKWVDEICSHMISSRKPDGYWTKERCAEEIAKYQTFSEMSVGSSVVLQIVYKRGWADELLKGLSRSRFPRNYWTKERCQEAAKNFDTRKDFQYGAPSAYGSAKSNCWLDAICGHMKRVGSFRERAIYEIADEEKKTTYIGLSIDPEKRYREHLLRNTSAKTIIESSHIFRVLTKLLPVDKAAIEEENIIRKRVKEGWIVLNKVKGGALGGRKLFWTMEKLKQEAKKYKTRSAFHKGSNGAYDKAYRDGCLDEICGHMISPLKPKGFWTKERCWEEAKKYNSRTDFHKKASSPSTIAYHNKWIDEICSHMIRLNKPDGYWTKERCLEEAKKYDRRVDFHKKASSAYNSAHRNKWIDEICSHMQSGRKPNGFWTKERCRKEAIKYKSRNKFSRGSRGAYASANRNGWLDEICGHIISPQNLILT